MPENMLGAEKNITEAKMLEFGDGKEKYASKESFGNKGSILIDMSSIGVPIPPGFVLNVSVCEDYFKNSRSLPDEVPSLLRQGILFIEDVTGKFLGALLPFWFLSGLGLQLPCEVLWRLY